MITEPRLLQLPGDWPPEPAATGPPPARFDYDAGRARLSITWEVSAAESYSPQDEALAIATLLEQAQGFQRAFQLANLGELTLVHDNGSWLPAAKERETPQPLANGLSANGLSANGNGLPRDDHDYYDPLEGETPAPPPAPAPPVPYRDLPNAKAAEVIEPCVTFTDPALVKAVKTGGAATFEDWQATKARLRAAREQKERLLAGQQPAGMAVPPVPPQPETLDEAIERAEAEGRLLPVHPLPVHPPAKERRHGKRLNYGRGLSPADHIWRLLKSAGRPVTIAYVAKQRGVSYEAARKQLAFLEGEGQIERVPKEKIEKGGAWFDYQIKEGQNASH